MVDYDEQISFWLSERAKAQESYNTVAANAHKYARHILQYLLQQYQSQIDEANHFLEVMNHAKTEKG